MDEQIARIALNQGATPQTKTYLTDALGSVIAISKADQTLEVGYAYSPYGQTSKVGVENQQAGSENNSQYTGRENDNNGLYYYRARYYDPTLKRFISEDPIGLAGGINSHAYVEGDPVSFTDPEGFAKIGGSGSNSSGTTGSPWNGWGNGKPLNPPPSPWKDSKDKNEKNQDLPEALNIKCLFYPCKVIDDQKKVLRCAKTFCTSNTGHQFTYGNNECVAFDPVKVKCTCLKWELSPDTKDFYRPLVCDFIR